MPASLPIGKACRPGLYAPETLRVARRPFPRRLPFGGGGGARRAILRQFVQCNITVVDFAAAAWQIKVQAQAGTLCAKKRQTKTETDMAAPKATQTAAKAIKEPMQAATDSMEHFAAANQEKLRETFDRGVTAMSEVGAFGKENVEALMASATAASKGLEALSARAVAYSKTAMENHVAATKALMGSKSVQEAIERQTDYARSAFDNYIAEMNRMSDLMTGVTKEAMKPLNERFTAVSHIVQTGIKTGVAR